MRSATGLMYARHRLDLALGDLLTGALACLGVGDRSRSALRVRGVESDGMVSLSVRTGWDLYLRALRFAEGDEVLVSAVTHPDMARIARGHGLRVVTLDLDQETLAPRAGCLEAAVTEKTRVVLVAHLFGGRVDLGPVARFATEHGLLLVEDCAQAFAGPGRMGNPEADASLYSFGTLKTATALGGAVLKVKDGRVLGRMREMQAEYPVQDRAGYAARLLRALLLVCAGGPRIYGLVFVVCAWLGLRIDDLIGRATRSFPDEGSTAELFRRIRRRPSAPLVAMLARRLERFDGRTLAARAAGGDRLSRALDARITQPGRGSDGRTHWLFPVVVRDPDGLIRGLRERGFDASRAPSSVVALRRAGKAGSEPTEAENMMAGIVFLPAYPAMRETDLDRLAAEVNAISVAAERVRRVVA